MAPVAAPLTGHRLTLNAAELALLFDSVGATLPPGFDTVEVADSQLRAAAATLSDRGILIDDGNGSGRPTAPVAANLATLTGAAVSVQIDVSLGDRWSRSWHSVCGPLGASLFALADGAAELSLFGATALGWELIRAVPLVEDPGTPEARLARALGGAAAARPPLVGWLPLRALAEYAPTRDLSAGAGPQHPVAALELSPPEALLARQITERTSGVLRCLVIGSVPGAGTGQRGVVVGQVVWLATDDGGWLGLRPEPDGSGRRPVSVRPVTRDQIGTWLAPYLADVLRVAP